MGRGEILERLTAEGGVGSSHPMKVIADQKRRVVLPKPTEPGDVFEVLGTGDRLVLVRLKASEVIRPLVSEAPLSGEPLEGIDLDEPAFTPLSDEGAA